MVSDYYQTIIKGHTAAGPEVETSDDNVFTALVPYTTHCLSLGHVALDFFQFLKVPFKCRGEPINHAGSIVIYIC